MSKLPEVTDLDVRHHEAAGVWQVRVTFADAHSVCFSVDDTYTNPSLFID